MATRLLRALSVALILLVARPAAALEGCPEPVERWLAAFSAEASVPASAEVCQARLLVVRLSPAGAEPLNVEVALGSGPAFRRVGELRVSPVLQVADLSAVAAPRREAFERLVAYIERHPDAVVVAPPAVSEGFARAIGHVGIDFAGPRLLLLALLAAALALSLGRRPSRADAVTAGALVGGALALRLLFGAFGPHHVNGQAVLWIAGGMQTPADLTNYGPGYPELFGWTGLFAENHPDLALFSWNGVISSLIPVATYALARLAGLERVRALAAALVMAIEPVGVRIATTETYFVPIAALTLIAGACFMAAAREVALPRVAWLLAGGLLVAQAARVHPAAWPLATIAPGCAIATAGATWRDRLPDTARAALAASGITALTSAGTLVAVWGGLQAGVLSHPGLPPQPWRFGVLALLMVLLARRARPSTVLVPAGLAAVALLLTRHAYAPSPLLERSYDLTFAPLLLVGLAAALPPWRAAPAAVAVVALLAALLPVSWPAASTATTEQLEYAWLRNQLRALPQECRLLHVSYAGSRVMRVPSYDGRPVVRYDERTPPDLALALGGSGCTVYVRSSLCGSPEGRPRCRVVERKLAMSARASTELPAVPSVVAAPYSGDRVTVGLYDVEGLVGTTETGAAATTGAAVAPAP